MVMIIVASETNISLMAPDLQLFLKSL